MTSTWKQKYSMVSWLENIIIGFEVLTSILYITAECHENIDNVSLFTHNQNTPNTQKIRCYFVKARAEK